MATLIESLFNKAGYQRITTISEADRKAALEALEIANQHLDAAKIRKQAADIDSQTDSTNRERTLENTRSEARAAADAQVIATQADAESDAIRTVASARAQAEAEEIFAEQQRTTALYDADAEAKRVVTDAKAQAQANEIAANQQRITNQRDAEAESVRLETDSDNERARQAIERSTVESDRTNAETRAQTAELEAAAATNRATAENAPKIAAAEVVRVNQANIETAAKAKLERKLAEREVNARLPNAGGGWRKTKLAGTLLAGLVGGSFLDDFTREAGGYRLIDFGGQYEYGFETLVPVNDTTQTQAAQRAKKLLEDTLTIGIETQGQSDYASAITRASPSQARQMACLGNSFASAIALVRSAPNLGENDVAGLAEQNATDACFDGNWERNNLLTDNQIGAVQLSAILATKSLGIRLK